MKKRLLITVIALSAVIALFLIGLQILPMEKPAVPLENAEQMYNTARISISTAPDMSLKIVKSQDTTVGSEVFSESSQLDFLINGLGTDNIRAKSTEQLSVGNHDVAISEVFTDNTCYITINDSHFSCPITLDNYMKRFTYAGLLDATLYRSITGIDDAEQYIISFSQPIAAEHWATDANYELVDAAGTVCINYDGLITKSTYTLTYSTGKAIVNKTYTVDITLSAEEISTPENTDNFLPIDYIDGPRMLESASGYLLQANNITSNYTDSIYFQAFGDSWARNVTLHMANGESLSALVETLTTLKNDSRVGHVSQLSNTELFADGGYLESTDGKAFKVNNDISAGDMLMYCQNSLLRNIMLPENITSAQIIASEDSLKIQFSASDEFARQISANACLTLYQDSELLENLASSRTTDTLQCYLELDVNSGLPIASGINYSGTHSIEDTPYVLHYDAEQTYDITSQIAAEEINKAAG
jgi:hypothetical protein